MSLELAIQANTEALRDLITTLKAGIPTSAAQVAAVVAEAQPAKKEETKPAAKTVAAEVLEHHQAQQAAAAESKPAPTYADAAAAITALSRAKGRDAAVEVLGKFGATNLKEVKPEQFAEVIDAANKALGV